MSQAGFPVPSTLTHKNQAKISDGRSVKVTVPQSTTVLVGDPVLLDGYFGFAVFGAETGVGETAEIVLNIEQAEFITDVIDTNQTYAKGAVAYWDDSAKKITSVKGSNREIGRVTRAKDSANTICITLAPQNVPAVPVTAIPEADNVAAVDATDATAVAAPDAVASAAAPTKAEFDPVVTLANENKAKINALVTLANGNKVAINAILAALKEAGLMAADA
jgi:predicted RecA/RadA family phage recombinase